MLKELMSDETMTPVEVGESPTPKAPAAPKESNQGEEQSIKAAPSDDGPQQATITNQNVLNALGLEDPNVEVVRSLSESEVVVKQGDKEFVVGVEVIGG